MQLHKSCLVFIENGAFAARPRLGERRAKSEKNHRPSLSEGNARRIAKKVL